MHTFGLRTLRASMIRGIEHGDLFSNMYIIAVVGVVVQYLISEKATAWPDGFFRNISCCRDLFATIRMAS